MSKIVVSRSETFEAKRRCFVPGGFCLFSRGFYFLFCSLMNSLIWLHKQVYSRVSSIIDVFVFAREGAVKGNGELNKISRRED